MRDTRKEKLRDTIVKQQNDHLSPVKLMWEHGELDAFKTAIWTLSQWNCVLKIILMTDTYNEQLALMNLRPLTQDWKPVVFSLQVIPSSATDLLWKDITTTFLFNTKRRMLFHFKTFRLYISFMCWVCLADRTVTFQSSIAIRTSLSVPQGLGCRFNQVLFMLRTCCRKGSGCCLAGEGKQA